MNEQTAVEQGQQAPQAAPPAPPTREQRVLERAQQIAASMGMQDWNPDGGGEATPAAPESSPPSPPASQEQTPTEQKPPAPPTAPQEGEQRLSINPDELDDDAVDELVRHPKLSNRAIRMKMDEAVRLITAGRSQEVDPEIRALALKLFEGDKELAKPIEQQGYQRGREESEHDQRLRQSYEQLMALRNAAWEGDAQAEATWKANEEAYEDWLADYRRYQKSKSQPQPVDEEALRKEVEAKVRADAENQVIITHIQGWLESLDAYQKLSLEEQDKVYREWMQASGGDLKKLYAEGNKWELKQEFQQYGGEQTAKRAEQLVMAQAEQDRLRNAANPDTTSGTDGTDLIRSLEDAAKAFTAKKISRAEYAKYRTQFGIS